jgi:hypothetical protein
MQAMSSATVNDTSHNHTQITQDIQRKEKEMGTRIF